MKKRVLFIVDFPDWAFDHMVKEVIHKLSGEYEFYWDFSSLFTKARTEYKVNTLKALVFNCFNYIKCLVSKTNLGNKINVVHYLSLTDNRISSYVADTANNFLYQGKFYKRNILKYNEYYDVIFHMDYYYQYSTALLPHRVKNNNYIVGIYTEGFPHNGPNYDYRRDIDISNITQEEFFNQYIKNYKALVVGSKNLQHQYSPFKIPTFFCTAIYKESDFIVSDEKKYFEENLVIGWTGNPNREFKGFESIIKPAIEKVKATGRKVILQTKFSGTYESLIKFYENVSLCLIASTADTGPSMFVEASLSAIPCISTNVGFPSMVIKNNVNGFIVERDIDAFFEKICFLYDNRSVLCDFSKKIKSDYMSVLGNDILMNNWRKAIDETLSPSEFKS